MIEFFLRNFWKILKNAKYVIFLNNVVSTLIKFLDVKLENKWGKTLNMEKFDYKCLKIFNSFKNLYY